MPFIIRALVLAAFVQPAAAEDRSVSLSIGYGHVEADEKIFDSSGLRSHLTWTAEVPMATVEVHRDLPSGWALSGSMTTALGNGAYMSDFDWLASGTDDWSHRSLHPDTRLSHYVDADLAVGRDMPGPTGMTVNMHGGLRYSDVEWDARGGSLVYSSGGFRDYSTELPDGLTVVTYRQRQVSLFAGVEAVRQFGDWTVSGRVRGGVGIAPQETDHHWLRDLRFDRSYDIMPFVDLTARVDYRLNDRTTAYIQARHVRHDDRRGNTTYSHIISGQEIESADGNAGMGLSVTQLSVGVSRGF